MRSVEKAPVPAAHQLSMMFDSVALRGLSPTERKTVIGLLANLLLEANGLAGKEHDDEHI